VSVSLWPNLRHLGEPLGGAKGQLEVVSFKKATEGRLRVEEEWRMPDGSEFHTVGAATLKPREANAVRTLEWFNCLLPLQ